MKKILVFGASGYLGSHIVKVLNNKNYDIKIATSRADDLPNLSFEIATYQPDIVICAIGKSGVPASSWHNEHPQESIRHNLIAVLNIVEYAARVPARIIVLGTGFVFTDGTDEHPSLDNSIHNPQPNFYCCLRSIVETTILSYNNTLVLRVNYPTTSDLDPRGMFGKVSKMNKVHQVPFSTTIVPDLFPRLPKLIESDYCGAINFVNTGSVSPFTYAQALKQSKDIIEDTSRIHSNVLDNSMLVKLTGSVERADILISKIGGQLNINR